MQHPVLKLSVDTEHFHQSSGGCNSEPMLQMPVFVLCFLKLYCDVDLPSVG